MQTCLCRSWRSWPCCLEDGLCLAAGSPCLLPSAACLSRPRPGCPRQLQMSRRCRTKVRHFWTAAAQLAPARLWMCVSHEPWPCRVCCRPVQAPQCSFKARPVRCAGPVPSVHAGSLEAAGPASHEPAGYEPGKPEPAGPDDAPVDWAEPPMLGSGNLSSDRSAGASCALPLASRWPCPCLAVRRRSALLPCSCDAQASCAAGPLNGTGLQACRATAAALGRPATWAAARPASP